MRDHTDWKIGCVGFALLILMVAIIDRCSHQAVNQPMPTGLEDGVYRGVVVAHEYHPVSRGYYTVEEERHILIVSMDGKIVPVQTTRQWYYQAEDGQAVEFEVEGGVPSIRALFEIPDGLVGGGQ